MLEWEEQDRKNFSELDEICKFNPDLLIPFDLFF